MRTHAALAAIAALFFPITAIAQDATIPASLTKAFAGYYNAEKEMKDCSVDLRQVRTIDKDEHIVEGRYVWKAPDRHRIVSTQPTAEIELREAGENLVPARGLAGLLEHLTSHYDFAEAKDGDGFILNGTSKPGGPASTITLWIDGANRLTHFHMTGTLNSGEKQEAEVTMTCEERDGKRLLTSSTLGANPPSQSMLWEYVKVGNVYLVGKETQVREKSKTVTEYKNHQVDQGVDDKVFEKR